MENDTHTPLFCDRCLRTLVPGGGDFYVVTIEAVADPTPMINIEEPFRKDIQQEISDLISQMEELSERELMDQVHRRATLHLCNGCYVQWIENPTGT